MPNSLDIYDPIFYAQEALIVLEKALGMAGRIHRGYSPTATQKGSTISIRKPSTFVVYDAPHAAQDLAPSHVDVTLNYWREVKFALTDKDLAFTKEDIIREHIRPAAYALADDVDQKLAALYKDVPWFFDQAAADVALKDIALTRKVMFDNQVPMKDPGALHMMVDGNAEAGLLTLLAPYTTAGARNEEALRRGTLGEVFGLEIFANQNTPSHTPGVSADATGVAAAALIRATTMNISAVTVGGTVKKGDTFSIAGHTQRYAFTGDFTADAGGILQSATFTPGLQIATAGAEVVTIRLDAHVANLAFHHDAFALATAPLSEMGGELGARIATIPSPDGSLILRSRLYYVGDESAVKVALDILYGFKTLNPNLAVRLCA